ncbi:MAG: S8 family serine peptidase, partial [Chloroflexota bacterium]
MSHFTRLKVVLLVAALLLLRGALPLSAAPPLRPMERAGAAYVPGQLLVGIKPGVVGVSAMHRAVGATVMEIIGGSRPVHVVQLSPTTSIASAIAAYRKDPRVTYAEPNYIAHALLPPPNDPSVANGNQWALQKIQAVEAWALFPNTYYTAATKPGNAVKVAVVDSGIDYNHNDFVNVGGAGSNVTQGGQIDRADGYNFVTNTSDPLDNHGHGTHVAGTVGAATNNGGTYTVNGVPQGVAGIGYNAQIIPIKVLDETGYGSYATIANGIIRAADRGAVIINLSLGGTAFSQTLQNAVNYAWSKGSVVLAAAGNSGDNTPL